MEGKLIKFSSKEEMMWTVTVFPDSVPENNW